MHTYNVIIDYGRCHGTGSIAEGTKPGHYNPNMVTLGILRPIVEGMSQGQGEQTGHWRY